MMSTHLTEKGALLLALYEVMDYLSIYTKENYQNFLEHHNLDGEPVPLAIWRREDLEEQPCDLLWDVWGFWADFWWSQRVDWHIQRTQVQP
jgi:hypothetical protein